jgi:hypothetical protein
MRVLIIANQTMGGADLDEAILARMKKDQCEFTLLIPATPLDHFAEAAQNLRASHMTTVDDTDRFYEAARHRLEGALEHLRHLGVNADGDVGSSDPVHAVRDTLAHRQFDEVIVSTLPLGASRWLHQDVPHRIHRKFRLPVTVVTASSSVKD